MTGPESTSLLQFPCEYPLKVFGRPGAELDSVVRSIVTRHVGELPESAYQTRMSRGGNYTALTITFQASSKQQLDALYTDLTAAPEVMMAL